MTVYNPPKSASQTPWTSNIDGGGYDLSNVGAITATNLITSSAGLVFKDRTTARAWQWYGTGDTAYLWNGSNNIISLDPSGNLGMDIGTAQQINFNQDGGGISWGGTSSNIYDDGTLTIASDDDIIINPPSDLRVIGHNYSDGLLYLDFNGKLSWIGDGQGGQNGTFLQVDDANEVISAIQNDYSDGALKLDFVNKLFSLGDWNDNQNGTYIQADDNNNNINTSFQSQFNFNNNLHTGS